MYKWLNCNIIIKYKYCINDWTIKKNKQTKSMWYTSNTTFKISTGELSPMNDCSYFTAGLITFSNALSILSSHNLYNKLSSLGIDSLLIAKPGQHAKCFYTLFCEIKIAW